MRGPRWSAWGVWFVRFRTASCCRKARFSRASSRCDLRLDRAVASRAYKQVKHQGGELDPEDGNVNDCALDEVLRRHSAVARETVPFCALMGLVIPPEVVQLAWAVLEDRSATEREVKLARSLLLSTLRGSHKG